MCGEAIQWYSQNSNLNEDLVVSNIKDFTCYERMMHLYLFFYDLTSPLLPPRFESYLGFKILQKVTATLSYILQKQFLLSFNTSDFQSVLDLFLF